MTHFIGKSMAVLHIVSVIGGSGIYITAAAQTPLITVTLGNKTQSDRFNVVLLGRLPQGMARTITFEVKNIDNKPVTLDTVHFGRSATSEWEHPSGELRNRLRLVPAAEGKLLVTLPCDQPPKKAEAPVVVIERNGVPTAYLMFVFSLHKPQISVDLRTPEVQSGLGKDKSGWYRLASGPAPFGYNFTDQTFEAGGSQRACNSHIECNLVQADNDSVEWKFAIEGFEHDNDHVKDEVAHAFGHLIVTYTLRPPDVPALLTEAEYHALRGGTAGAGGR